MTVSLAMVLALFGSYFSVPVGTTAPRDTTPPVVTGIPDRPANAHGWFNAAMSVRWKAVDPAPSTGTPTVPPRVRVTKEGRQQVITSAPSCDRAHNCAKGTYVVNIDMTAPVITMFGPQNGATYAADSVPFTSCGSEDNLSGLQTYAKVTETNNGDGTFTVTCSGATDPAGNTAAPISTTYRVV